MLVTGCLSLCLVVRFFGCVNVRRTGSTKVSQYTCFGEMGTLSLSMGVRSFLRILDNKIKFTGCNIIKSDLTADLYEERDSNE